MEVLTVRALLLVPLLALAACFDPSSAPSCTIACANDNDCPDGQTCSAASATCTSGQDCTMPETCIPGDFVACVDGNARTCNATGDGTVDEPCGTGGCNATEKRCNACVPSEVSCNGSQLQTCAADGSAQVAGEMCAGGCIGTTATTAAHCEYLAPVWMANICDEPATEDILMPPTASFDSNLETNCTGGMLAQPSGATICVVRYKTINIPSSTTLTLTGTHPVAFVADRTLTVAGTIDASATTSTSGPGGGQRTSGGGPSGSVGGGGAGFGTNGGNGGNTGAAGVAIDPLTLNFFAGGSRAYQPAFNQLDVPNGGGGGGAVMLVACRGSVTVSGTVAANGSGGQGAYDTVAGAQISPSSSAGGGGSGGYIVIQGLTVTVSGGIYANGGGGGGGCTSNDTSGGRGGSGQNNTTGGNGGAGVGAGLAGGRGGGKTTAPGVGGTGTSTGASGGGGGAVGVVQLYTPINAAPVITGSTFSPTQETNKTVPTR